MVRAKRLKPSIASKHLLSADQAVTASNPKPLIEAHVISPTVPESANLRPDVKARVT